MEIQEIFEDVNFELMMGEMGCRMPLTSLTLSDVPMIQGMLKMHVLVRVKGELDQFTEGLERCGVLDCIRQHPALMRHYFVHVPITLTAGTYCIFPRAQG